MTKLSIALILALAAGLGGCASYQAQPLDLKPKLAKAVRLSVDPAKLALPALRSHRFDPDDGLDGEEVVMLAVANSPRLKLARLQAGETKAQAYAAGLLPDPQLSASQDFPTKGGSGTVDAYGLGASFDLGALMLSGPSSDIGRHEAGQADLGLLWEDWQVASQARLLYTRITDLEQRRALLAAEQALYATHLRHAGAAFAAGNLTADALDSERGAAQALAQRLGELDRRLLADRHGLNALLGLDPQVHLKLVPGQAPAPLPAAEVHSEIASLARRRPDLLALAQGYAAQEARVRRAVWAQFPAINLGFNQARDTGGVLTNGFALTLSLPLWNGNRGQIAQERATRARLREEYQQRLAAADAKAYQLIDDGALITAELTRARQGAEAAERIAGEARTAYRAGNLDEAAYLQRVAAATDRRLDALALGESLAEQRIGLAIVLGSDAPLDAARGRKQ